jgi:hypothetical protein
VFHYDIICQAVQESGSVYTAKGQGTVAPTVCSMSSSRNFRNLRFWKKRNAIEVPLYWYWSCCTGNNLYFCRYVISQVSN